MKTILIVFLFLFAGVATCLGQENSIDFSLFRLNGLGFYSSKEAIVKKFGQPAKVVEPKYECGFHSEREQGEKYFQLNYGHIIFIGNEKEKYGIETMEFSATGKQSLEYGKWRLSGKTTTKAFAQIFGKAAMEKPTEYVGGEVGMTLFGKGADDGVIFFFKSGHLVRISYYSPC